MEYNIEYRYKYLKYKKKYLNLKYKGGDNSIKTKDGLTNITPTILGYGTDGITCPIIINNVLDNGYKILDMAEKYNNLDMISQVIDQKQIRDHIFIIYKIEPPNNIDSIDTFKKSLEYAIQKLKYIDCFMFHTYPLNFLNAYPNYFDQSRYDSMDKEGKEKILKTYENLKKYDDSLLEILDNNIKENKIRYLGFSNIYEHKFNLILKLEGKNDIFNKIKFVENKFTINDLMVIPDIIDQLKLVNKLSENNIIYMGYSAFGGKLIGACGQLEISIDIPRINFTFITHPNISEMLKSYNNDIIVILAYLSKKYNILQIPTSTNINRIQSNLQNFNKYIKEIDINKLHDAIKIDLCYDDKNKYISYKSRQNLYNHYNDKIILLKEIYNINYDDNIKKVILNKIFIILEYLTGKYLEDNIKILNKIFEYPNKKEILIDIFKNLEINIGVSGNTIEEKIYNIFSNVYINIFSLLDEKKFPINIIDNRQDKSTIYSYYIISDNNIICNNICKGRINPKILVTNINNLAKEYDIYDFDGNELKIKHVGDNVDDFIEKNDVRIYTNSVPYFVKNKSKSLKNFDIIKDLLVKYHQYLEYPGLWN
jgi:diketogulonate reductase-like aldo/keto reductase